MLPSGDHVALLEGAEDVLLGNLKRGTDPSTKQRFAYVCPSRKDYPWQWFWDSCFHAIALCHFDVELAKQELRTLLLAQQDDGFIPHVVHWGASVVLDIPAYWQSRLSWRPRGTELIQPPVLAQAALRVAQRSEDRAFVDEVLDKVKRYYLWLRDHRDPDADGLISVISPYETGMDQLPAYDEALGARNPSRLGLHVRDRLLDLHNLILGRNYNLEAIFRRDRFTVEDVMVNCIYAQGLRDTARLCRIAEDEVSEGSFIRMAERTEQAVLSRCYDEQAGAFWSLASRRERPLKVLTVSSLFPLILESIGKRVLERLVEEHLLREGEFWLPYPVPSVARSEPAFRPAERMVIWRGPSWVNINWFLADGLRRHGYEEPARAIAHRTAEMVLRSGFREFYNPLTGEGYGARDFGWSTLVVDML